MKVFHKTVISQHADPQNSGITCCQQLISQR